MGKKILIVDDSATVRQQVRTFLTSNGFAVIEAENGAVGVDRTRDCNPDLVIVDVNMPVMGGIEAVTEIRKLPAHAQTPIFMLTTEASRKLVDHGREAGVTAWMVKPFKPAILLKGVEAVLARVG